jgi:hypothetical protein
MGTVTPIGRDLEPSDLQGVTPNVGLWVVAVNGRFATFPTEAAARKHATDQARQSPGDLVTLLRPVAEIRATVNIEEKAL